MKHHRHSFVKQTPGRGLHVITRDVAAVVDQAHVKDGLATVFVHHTSASLVIQENASPDVLRDLDAVMARLAPDGDPLYTHTEEGPDDMSAHVKGALTQTSLGIPVVGGKLDLGRWQGVFLWEHRTRPHERRVSVVVVGE